MAWLAIERNGRSIQILFFHMANYNLFEEKEPTAGFGVTSMVINFKNITELCLRKRYRKQRYGNMNIDYFFSIYPFIFLPSLSIYFFIFLFNFIPKLFSTSIRVVLGW